MATKNRATFEKFARERRLQERREWKQEKKSAAKMAKALGGARPESDSVVADEHEAAEEN